MVAKVSAPDRDYGTDSTDPVRMYLQEMGSVPLLSREQEVTIAKEIESGLHEVRDCVYGLAARVTATCSAWPTCSRTARSSRATSSPTRPTRSASSAERDEKMLREFLNDVATLQAASPRPTRQYMPTRVRAAAPVPKTPRKPTAARREVRRRAREGPRSTWSR